MEYKPYYYQAFAENFILNNAAAGLLLDMGMGKTAISLTAADKLLFDYFAVRKVLVIAPLKPARETWPPEAKKWDHLRHLRFSLILGSKKERIAACGKDADIYIINREQVVWLVDYYKSAWPFDMVIIDELSSFKSSKAQRFRALKKVRKYITRIVGLTGTPSPNWNRVHGAAICARIVDSIARASASRMSCRTADCASPLLIPAESPLEASCPTSSV